MASNISLKRVQISKANTIMVIAIGIAAFTLTFAVISGRALLSKRAYQSRVISAKQTAVDQLQANIKATNSLVTSYKTFVDTPSNVLGGNPKGTGDKDGDNAKIILDALPSQYDFPALTSSLEKVLTGNNYKVSSISGVDDEIAQQETEQTSTPQPIVVPFEMTVTTDVTGARNLLGLLERSVRPINVQQLSLTSGSGQLQVSITAQTYYQPAKTVTIETRVIQ